MSTTPFNNREMLLFGAVVVLLSVAISVGVQGLRYHHRHHFGPFGQHSERFDRPGMRGGMDNHGPDGFMARADTNKDGFLTKDELMAGAQARIDKMFAEADTDHDGRLSKDELEKGREAMRKRMMERFNGERQ